MFRARSLVRWAPKGRVASVRRCAAERFCFSFLEGRCTRGDCDMAHAQAELKGLGELREEALRRLERRRQRGERPAREAPAREAAPPVAPPAAAPAGKARCRLRSTRLWSQLWGSKTRTNFATRGVAAQLVFVFGALLCTRFDLAPATHAHMQLMCRWRAAADMPRMCRSRTALALLMCRSLAARVPLSYRSRRSRAARSTLMCRICAARSIASRVPITCRLRAARAPRLEHVGRSRMGRM